MSSADTDVVDNDRKTQANPFEMGAGMIDPGGNQKGSAFNPGLVYDAGFFEYLGFLCDAAPEALSPTTCPFLESQGVPTDAFNLNYPSIGVSAVPGTRTITRTLTNVSNQTIRVSADVERPKGFDVIVHPRRLSIPAGGSASFEVTFNTTKAPIGEWRFGSLEWEGSGFDVRSPIAVRAAQIEAPGLVTGAGESGSVDIPVTFGYSGPYTATGHGLVPATLTVDNVLQDGPEDPAEFNPADVTTGGANVHEITIADASVFRIAMPPDATEADADLDIYVFFGGELVAASTSGGTDEEIIIEDPENGLYSVYVHGWAAPGGDSDYTMYTWIVPDAAGPTLTTTGPAAAVSGTTATVVAGWTGATLGQWHFGAVSHNDADSVMQRTLVDVDNR
jgi:hypothetical protein